MYYVTYTQTIKLQSASCNSGECSGNETVYTDTVYSVGRKEVSNSFSCDDWYGYELGDCAC